MKHTYIISKSANGGLIMKKMISLILLLSIVFYSVACSSTTDERASEQMSTEEEAVQAAAKEAEDQARIAEVEKAEAEKLLAETMKAEEDARAAAEKALAEKVEAEKMLAEAKSAEEKSAAEKLLTEKIAFEKATAEAVAKAVSQKAAAEKAAAEKAAAEKAAAEKATAQKSGITPKQEIQTVSVVIPGSAAEEKMFREQHKIFMKQNPNIKVDFVSAPSDATQYGNVIQLMFASNEPPDIFRISGSYPTKMTLSYSKGWLMPLNKFITPEFRKKMPGTFFKENSGLFVGKEMYGTPLMDVQFNAFRPFYYNIDILKQYGYNEPPRTWSQLKKMAEDITAKGNGKVFGFTAFGKVASVSIMSLSDYAANQYSDAHITEGSMLYDMKSGKSAANNPASIAAVDYVKDLHYNKIMPTGWEAWDATMAIQQFANGRVAMMIGQAYFPVEIYKINPKFNLGITIPPLPDNGRGGYKYLYNAAEPYFGISSKSKVPEAAWKLLEFYASSDFQAQFYEITARPTYLWESYPKELIKPYTIDIMSNANKSLKVAPYPGFMHPDGEELLSNVLSKLPKPNLQDLYMLGITGNKNYSDIAAEYDQKVDKIIDDVQADLKQRGSQVTRSIFIAPKNWNPNEDFGEE
jgi:multiple sugar transport system substrate-binding protein